MKQRSSKIVAFPGKIRRPPATLRGSLEGGAILGPFLNSRRRLLAQVTRECRREIVSKPGEGQVARGEREDIPSGHP